MPLVMITQRSRMRRLPSMRTGVAWESWTMIVTEKPASTWLATGEMVVTGGLVERDALQRLTADARARKKVNAPAHVVSG